MELKVYHRTRYDYSSHAKESINDLKLHPKSTQTQECRSCIVSVSPSSPLRPFWDSFGNQAHHVEISEDHRYFVVEARMRVVTKASLSVEEYPYGVSMSTLPELRDQDDFYTFLRASSHVAVEPSIWKEAKEIQAKSDDVFQTAYAIMAFIFKEYAYIPGATNVSTHANEVIKRREGVCQDFAHAMIAYCRSLGIPARYISGYFFDTTRDSSLRGSEATHAWVEVFIKGHGWIGLDPTNNKIIDDTYIIMAVGRDYSDVAPITGSFIGGGTSTLSVFVRVKRVA